MHKRDLANIFLLTTVFALSLFICLSADTVPKGKSDNGTVLGESTVADADDTSFSLFVEGLISKRKQHGDTNCDFVVSEETSTGSTDWEGELIWNDSDNYKLFLDQAKRVVSVNQGDIYEIKENGTRQSFGNIHDGGSGSLKYTEISNYIFEDFLSDVAEHPAESRLLGEETIDGIKYYILEDKFSIANPGKATSRKFYVSEEGIFLKAEIEDKTDDYEVYDSSGAAVVQKGYEKKINLEVKNRVFF